MSSIWSLHKKVEINQRNVAYFQKLRQRTTDWLLRRFLDVFHCPCCFFTFEGKSEYLMHLEDCKTGRVDQVVPKKYLYHPLFHNVPPRLCDSILQSGQRMGEPCLHRLSRELVCYVHGKRRHIGTHQLPKFVLDEVFELEINYEDSPSIRTKETELQHLFKELSEEVLELLKE